MTTDVFIGIDPGKNGAIAAINGKGQPLDAKLFKAADTDGRIALIVADFISKFETFNQFICIEKVGAMPGQGVVSMFSFGRAYGEAWAGALLSKALLASVTPAVWQHALALPKRADNGAAHKRVLRQLAEARFGRNALIGAATADAFWLAEYCRLHGPHSIKAEV